MQPRSGTLINDSTGEGLSARAHHHLRELLVSGRLLPGFRIVEKDVASRLGISRTPVRSALQRLQQEGFIEASGAGRSTRWVVSPLTEDDVRELFSIVGAIEGLAAQRAGRLSARGRQPLVAALREVNQALRTEAARLQPRHDTVFELDTSFHRTFVETAGGRRLVALHDSIKPQAERYIRLYTEVLVGEIEESVEEHELIILEIERGEADAAKRAMESNWFNAAERLGAVIQ